MHHQASAPQCHASTKPPGEGGISSGTPLNILEGCQRSGSIKMDTRTGTEVPCTMKRISTGGPCYPISISPKYHATFFTQTARGRRDIKWNPPQYPQGLPAVRQYKNGHQANYMHNMHLANNMALNAFSHLCAVSKPRATSKKSWLLNKHQRKRSAQNRQGKAGYQVEPPSISSRAVIGPAV